MTPFVIPPDRPWYLRAVDRAAEVTLLVSLPVITALAAGVWVG